MIRAGTRLYNSVTGDHVTFLQGAAEIQGALLQVIWRLCTGNGAPAHWHPALAEVIIVLAGELHATINDRLQIFRSGGKVHLPLAVGGTIRRFDRHTHRLNVSSQ